MCSSSTVRWQTRSGSWARDRCSALLHGIADSDFRRDELHRELECTFVPRSLRLLASYSFAPFSYFAEAYNLDAGQGATGNAKGALDTLFEKMPIGDSADCAIVLAG